MERGLKYACSRALVILMKLDVVSQEEIDEFGKQGFEYLCDLLDKKYNKIDLEQHFGD